MRTSTWLSGRRTAPVLVVCLLVCGAAPPPAAAQCELDKLLASDGAAGDWFGFSVSVSGDVAVVGAHQDDDNGADSGSAYIYRWTGSAWVQEAKLTASDGAANDQFGLPVSINGDVVVLGASGDDAPLSNSGSAYVFVKPPGGWVDMTQTAKLTASDAAVSDGFGNSVSISGEVVVVGARFDDDNGADSGSAYVFQKPPRGWVDMTQTAKLTASDAALFDEFGISVSISGDVAVVGSRDDDDNGSGSGSAYVFVQPPGGWVDMTQTAKLLASDGAAFNRFGFSVSISGDVAVVGAYQDDDNGPLSGSAYVFVQPPGGWVNMTQTAKLLASDGAANDAFGISVSITGDVAVVGGVFDDDNGSNSGSAYVFEKPLGGWVGMTQTAKLTASDGAANDQFGGSVSISGDVVVLGAVFGDDNGSNSGSAYVFVGLLGLDYNGNGIPDVCELLCPADFDGSGDVGVKDLLFLLGNWGPCP